MFYSGDLHFKPRHTEVSQLPVAEHLVLRVQLEHIDGVVQHHRVCGLTVTLCLVFSHFENNALPLLFSPKLNFDVGLFYLTLYFISGILNTLY